jgi:uncharacterized protein (DUF488 family)
MAAPLELATIGYEGRLPDELVAVLRAAGVTRLIDIRERASSRKPGFSKTALAAALAAGGIEYVHHRDAGNPFRRIPDWAAPYRDHLARHPAIVDQVIELARARPSAILCVERAAAECHRRVLAEAIQNRVDATIRDL